MQTRKTFVTLNFINIFVRINWMLCPAANKPPWCPLLLPPCPPSSGRHLMFPPTWNFRPVFFYKILVDGVVIRIKSYSIRDDSILNCLSVPNEVGVGPWEEVIIRTERERVLVVAGRRLLDAAKWWRTTADKVQKKVLSREKLNGAPLQFLGLVKRCIYCFSWNYSKSHDNLGEMFYVAIIW